MPTSHPRPWHRDSTFGHGPRIPMCRERRAVWKARIDIQRRAGRVTDGEAYVGQALLKRLGSMQAREVRYAAAAVIPSSLAGRKPR
jgi:hypothetical protein